MLKHSKIDEAISEIEEQLDGLSMKREREIERVIRDVSAKYEQEKIKLSNALNHLQQAKNDLNTDNRVPIIKPSDTNSGLKQNEPELNVYENFPVKNEVRKILSENKGEFSPKDVKALLEKKFPRILESINPSSVHRALNDLVESKEMTKAGKGKYKVVNIKRESEMT